MSVFTVWEHGDFRRNKILGLFTRADIIGYNCKAALVFDDPKDAGETLSALQAEPTVVFACIYDAQGKVFAAYQRQDLTEKIKPPEMQTDGYAVKNDRIILFKDIKLDGETIGTINIQSDTSQISSVLIRHIGIAMLIILLSSFIAFFLSSVLQRIISGPILSLADVANVVSQKKDYSTRATKQSNDEVGLLIDAFNEMLEQIQQRESELVDGKAQLEIRVRQRTAELSSANIELEGEIEQRTAAQNILEKRIKELNCLFSLSKLIEQPGISLEQIFQDAPPLLRNAYQEPDKTCVRINFDGIRYKTDDFEKSELSQHAEIKVRGEKAGDIEIYYLGEKPESRQSPLLKEQRDLLDAVAQHLGRVAERKRTGEKLQLFRDLMNRSNDCIFIKEPQWGRFLDVNEKACNSLGYTQEELLNMTAKDIEPSLPDDASWTEHVKELREKGYMVSEGRHKRKDGTTFPVEVNVNFVEQGKTSYVVAVVRDITERKKAEEALEVSNRELRDFVYIASHDLREPLRKISSFGMLLEESLEAKLQPEDRENLEFMIDGANRMTQMINSLLEYSRIGTKEIVYETVDLNEAVEQLEKLELAALLEETDGIIEIPQPLPKVQADPVQIRQLLQNLITNGIKYRREGIRPRIVIRAEQAAEGAVRIEVQDNGIGVKEGNNRRIFKMFKRLHSRDKYGGAGIGLAVCQKIVDRHGGRIGVESKVGAGSTFWFTLPASKSLEQEQEKLISSLET